MSSKLSNYKKPLLNGIFAIYKEKGDSIQDYLTWIRLTLIHETRIEFGSIPQNFILNIRPKHCEPFVSGVLCVGFGRLNTKYTALTRFWDHEWYISGKLGIDSTFHTNDSPITNEMPFNHITSDMMKKSLESFIGTQEQQIPPTFNAKGLLLEKEPTFEVIKSIVEPKPYFRIHECHAIELLSFDPPNFKLKVLSDGNFSGRALVRDLGLKLNCCAVLTDSHLERMGIISTVNCLKTYEIHLNNIYDAIHKYKDIYIKDLKKFNSLMTDKRRFI